MVYARKLGGTTFNFQVSGRLWRNSLVMQDRESDTWWSQVTGRAIHGRNRGAQLQKLESIQTTWAEWYAAHPDTTLLAKTEGVTSSHYQKYFDNPERMGLFRAQWLAERMPGKTMVYGATIGPHAVAVTEEGLATGLASAELGSTPVVVARGSDGGVRAFVSRVEGTALALEADGESIVDQEGSTWDLDTGRCTAGTNQGARLETVAVTPVFWFAWSGFYPNTLVVD